MEDKQIELLMDVEEEDGSNCCDATVYNGICSGCKEHCGYASEDECKNKDLNEIIKSSPKNYLNPVA